MKRATHYTWGVVPGCGGLARAAGYCTPGNESLDGLRLLLIPERGDHSHAMETTNASANPLIRMPRETHSEPAHKATANATAVASNSIMKA
jgi:hypothetical protein